MTVTVKVEGLRELEQAMKDLTKAAGRGVLRRSLYRAAKPLAELAQTKVPELTGKLKLSIIVGSKLNGRQVKMHRRMFRDDRSSVELFVGPSYLRGDGGRHGHLQEFGTIHHGPQPFMRPAWDSDRKALLERLSGIMRVEIDKAILRAARKAERLRVRG